MKRIANIVLATLTAAAPLATVPVASAQQWRHGHNYDRHRDDYRNHRWRRGERLPAYYHRHYARVDWRRHHLRRPPRGYHWVRDDRGEYLLVGIATGVILSAILNN
jgi:Ni/Co efflux regulator RcnB